MGRLKPLVKRYDVQYEDESIWYNFSTANASCRWRLLARPAPRGWLLHLFHICLHDLFGLQSVPGVLRSGPHK
jgi:hypothetical protein